MYVIMKILVNVDCERSCEKGIKLMEVCLPFYSGWEEQVAHLMVIPKDLVLILGHLQFWMNYEFHHLVFYTVAFRHKTGNSGGCCFLLTVIDLLPQGGFQRMPHHFAVNG